MHALEKNGTCDLVSLPPGKKALRRRWVYTVKLNPNGIFARLKAYLVMKGYSKTYAADYQDTFSLISNMASVRCLFHLLLYITRLYTS